MINDNQALKWRFDVNTFRLLGRELITDRITAVFELVKNSYDANATRVEIELKNINLDGKIIISDDGIGMSFDDIRDKWMVVGTASKRKEHYSPKPFERRYVGEKGIGRFAVDKLGGELNIITKQDGAKEQLNVNINWNEYEKLSKNTQLTLFTDIENTYSHSPAAVSEHGTTLLISSLNEKWTKPDIIRLERELEKIVSPFYPLKPPFNIFLTVDSLPEYQKKLVKADSILYATHKIKLAYDLDKGTQETLAFDKSSGVLSTKDVTMRPFGPIKVDIYYFNEESKRKYNAAYKNDESRIDGIKVYRDGVITTPFAEMEGQRDKKRDILGIDKRLWSGFLDKVGTREFIGVVEISKDSNPKIIDSTNRQDFVDNYEYRDLKSFIIEQLNTLSELKKFEREKNKTATTVALERAKSDIRHFTKALTDLEKEKPELKNVLQPLRNQAQEIDKSIAKGITEQKKERKEQIRKENIFLSLMSLQEYAVHVSHAVRTSLGKVKRMAEFFSNNFPNSKYENLFKEYSKMIYNEMNRLNVVIDFMLSYAASNTDFEEFSVKELIDNLLLNAYNEVFSKEQINVQVDIIDDFILLANKKFFEDIIQNLISNSIKALQDQADKLIKCSGYIENNQFTLYFSDNGYGITEGDSQKIFEIYYTTTADQGGSGVGLFIVKTRVESLQGTIEVVESEFKPIGATFKLTFPFKKQ
jgi:signal transduction histidine kinase